MVVPQLLLLLGTAASIPTSPFNAMEAWSGDEQRNDFHPLTNRGGDEVALIQAQLPSDIIFSISRNEEQSPNSDVSGFAQSSPEIGRHVGCVLPPPLPPNTDDCGSLVGSMSQVSSYSPPPRGWCFRYEYRSCYLFNCAGSCQAEGFQFEEWYTGLVEVMNRCVVGLGKGGFFESQGEHGEIRGKTGGVLHIDVPGYTVSPVFNLCIHESLMPDAMV